MGRALRLLVESPADAVNAARQSGRDEDRERMRRVLNSWQSGCAADERPSWDSVRGLIDDSPRAPEATMTREDAERAMAMRCDCGATGEPMLCLSCVTAVLHAARQEPKP